MSQLKKKSVVGTHQTATDLALIGTFAALIAVCSLIAVTVAVVPVPITLQTFAVLLTGIVLGPRRGGLAVSLYLVVGFAGLPVFAGGSGGFASFASPSLGYLLSFPLAAVVAGAVARRATVSSRALRTPIVICGAVLGTLTTYVLGVPVMAWRAEMPLVDALLFNNVFVPFDIVKLILAGITAAAVFRAFPGLLHRGVPTQDALGSSGTAGSENAGLSDSAGVSDSGEVLHNADESANDIRAESIRL